MIATEIAQRSQAGAGFRPLCREYHIGPVALRRILVEMGATIHPSSQCAANERPAQVKAEMLQRYQGGDGLIILMRDYHIGQTTLRRLLVSMGATIRPMGARVGARSRHSREENAAAQRRGRERRMAAGGRCIRCEILVRFDPGQDGYCGECWEEVSHAVVP